MDGSPGLKNWIKLLALGLVWGGSFMGISVALRDIGPLTIAAGRIALGAVLLVAIVRARGSGLPDPRGGVGRRVWIAAIGMGLFSSALPFALLSWGQTYVASGFAGVCMAAVPLFVLPLAHVFVPAERLTLRRGISFLIGFVGVLVLIGLDAFRSVGSDHESLARLACLGAALCYAIGSIITRLCPPVNMLALAAAALSSATVMMVPAALIVEGMPATWPTPLSLGALLYLGILPTALAQVLLVQVIRDTGPGFLSQVNYQVPVWSVIFGALLLGEALPPQLLISLVLILGGLLLSRKRRKAIVAP
ncbi:Permease of the drug/metabolite transporter (DMT) superfamily [Salinihabitans flavidus]|uniref:Permease of the drug/metabolite transporter (DMT) superfamily n=1 Tax=Salinihabitans flavidus TaxID=569882 RepID=A0A1H8LA55_9RHOB|nr:DMT family transporter [Salinihabitans flavidus]SEO01949.1 Permease of the drug/metabolite transporter (DMT) superfamily [Salinihabitans flavidus]